MRNLLIVAAASTALLAGCADMGMGADAGVDASANAGVAADVTPEEKTAFTRMAASSDLFEIQSSQLALTNAQNPAVRQFAQMMITDHTAMSQQLMAAASAAGVPAMTPQLLPMHAEMLATLQAGGAAGFDNRYARAQLQAHEMALALHSNYAKGGDAQALRTVAAAATPKVQQHLAMVRQWPGL